jgi:hypothetical protein
MGAGSGLQQSRIIHHGADELLVQQNSVPDGVITLPIHEGTQYTYPLSSFLSDLIDVS